MSIRRSILATLATLAVLSGAPTLLAVPAAAEQRYGPLGGHIGEAGPGGSGNGELSHPSGVTIAPGTGNVYVVDTDNNRVEQFDAAGTYLSQFDGAATPEHSFANPTAIALDQTTGDLYVVDTGHNVVDKFTPAGEYLCEFSGWERGCQVTPTGPSTFSEPLGVAIDPTTGATTSGDVYIADKGNRLVDVFTDTGVDAAQFEPGDLTEPGRSPEPYRPWSLAVDANHDIFVSGAGAEQVNEYTALGAAFLKRYSGATLASGVHIRTVGLDLQDGNALIGAEAEGEGYEVFVFNPAGQPTPSEGQNSFGAGLMSSFGTASPGIAVNPFNHAAYVSDPSSNVVDVFNLVTVPDATTGSATNVRSTSASLAGLVNSHNTSGSEYVFQYGTSTAYGSETEATPVGEGEAEPAVANLTELEPGTTYHYRLVATNGTGLRNTGEDETFTTASLPPEVTVGEPSSVTAYSVILHGEINPGRGATTYHFELGPTTSYGTVLPEIGIGSGEASVEAQQASPANLKPNTTYHYRLVAVNSAGEATSVDHTFRTLTIATPPEMPPVVSTGPATVTGMTEATISAIVYPEGLPTTWVLELGTAAGSYETRLFGSLAGEPGSATPTATLNDLRPGTVYHYRIVATNAAGTSEGPDRTFATMAVIVDRFPEASPLLPIPVFPAVKDPPTRRHKPHRHHKHHPAKKHAKAKKSRR
jgi:DNA-binding beta-propeller fold protein YncE